MVYFSAFYFPAFYPRNQPFMQVNIQFPWILWNMITLTPCIWTWQDSSRRWLFSGEVSHQDRWEVVLMYTRYKHGRIFWGWRQIETRQLTCNVLDVLTVCNDVWSDEQVVAFLVHVEIKHLGEHSNLQVSHLKVAEGFCEIDWHESPNYINIGISIVKFEIISWTCIDISWSKIISCLYYAVNELPIR